MIKKSGSNIERYLKSKSNKTAHVFRKRTVRDSSGNQTVIFQEKKGSIDGFLYTASAFARTIKGKYKSDIEAYFITPYGFDFEIELTDKIVIDAKEYTALTIDNIAFQDRVLQISMKRF